MAGAWLVRRVLDTGPWGSDWLEEAILEAWSERLEPVAGGRRVAGRGHDPAGRRRLALGQRAGACGGRGPALV